MRISELRKLVREIIRETVIDKDGLERVAVALPQTKEKKQNEAYTKGQLFGGTIKIGGQPVKVEVELLGADNKKKVFITKVINIDKKYLNKLPSNGILEIPARVFRTPGGGWYKIKTPSVFEAITTKNHKPVKKGGADDNFTKHHKTSGYAPDYGHPAELDTIDFDDTRKKQAGHQTNTKDTEDRGYEPVKELKKASSAVKREDCGCGCGGVTEGGCNIK